MSKRPRIMLSAGEASGDMHAAHAIEALHAHGIDPVLYGMGGPHLANLGMELTLDCRELAVIGIVEVLIQYRKIMAKLEILRDRLRSDPPDLLILVDYPDFNLKLAETAKSLGIPVLFYVSPQVWAWRPKRVERIGNLVDMMAVLFPFEVKFYEEANIPVRFVGHPLVDEVYSNFTPSEAKQHLDVDESRPLVGLLPGSRKGEIKRVLPILLESAKHVLTSNPDVAFVIPVAPTLQASELEEQVTASGLEIKLVSDKTYDVMQACDAIITASGTATLEVGMMQTPMAIAYRVNPITFAIMHRMITIPDIGLVNIVAGKRIVEEFIQKQADPMAIAQEITHILNDDDYRKNMIEELKQVKEKMGDGGASENVAQLIKEMLPATNN